MSFFISARQTWIGSRLAASILALAVIAAPRLATAGVITFSVPTIYLTESNQAQTGFFDVTVSEPGGGNNLYQSATDLLLPSQNNVTFINADLDTTAPYVFAGNSPPEIYPFPPGESPFLTANEAY